MDEYLNKFPNNEFSLLNYNIRSFHCNKQSFATFLESFPNNFDIIVLSETWNTSSTVGLCFLESYDSHHTIREHSRGGGVSVFVSRNFNSFRVNELCLCTDDIESCVVKISSGALTFFIIGIYRPPRGSIENFLLSIENLFNSILLNNKFIIFTGDINIDLLDTEGNNTMNYLNLMYSFNLIPTIDKITRYSNNENNIFGTILDHIFINKINTYSSGTILFDLSDHCPTFIHLNLNVNNKSDMKRKIVFRNFTTENLQLFSNKLSSINWNLVLSSSNVDECFDSFINTISDLYCQSFPLKTKYLTNNRINKPWISGNLLRLIKSKSEYLKLYKLGCISKETNNRFKNFVTREIRKAENLYYLDNFKNFNKNIKHSWNILKNLTGVNKSGASSNPMFISNNYDDKLSTVERFNKYFANIGNYLDSKIVNINDSNVQPNFNNPNSFFFFPVTDKEIDKIIVNLKSVRSGTDSIPIKIFKDQRHLFIHPLRTLINMSFQKGIFPSCLKLARITPIHKQGDFIDPSNFRPISCLPYISKIVEKCVKERLVGFCKKFSLINPSQFGFQRNVSTCDAVIHLTEIIYESLNNGNHLLAIMIDLKKAFDTVNHVVLLKKLQCYGFRGVQLDWFSSYLSNRKCYVEVDGVRSNTEVINIGVPQGSILGPILFLLYINDVSLISESFSTTLFADDTTVSISDKSFNDLIVNTNCELSKLFNWTTNNRLTLNVNKTVALYFSNKKINNADIQICLGNESINHVVSSKFLGVYLDENLNFVPHIRYVSNKIAKHIGIMYKIKDKLTTEAKLNYYYAFVYPYLSYNVCVWGSTFQTHLLPIIILQKRMIRLMTNSGFLDHTRPLFAQLGLLEFPDVYRYNILNYVFKALTKDKVTFNNVRNTRDPFLIKPAFHRLSKTQHAFSYTGPSEWNKLPLHLRKIDNYVRFKKSLKEYLLSSYSY